MKSSFIGGGVTLKYKFSVDFLRLQPDHRQNDSRHLRVGDSNDYARSEKVLRNLERKYNLTQVVGSQEAKERALSNNEIAMMKRKNNPSAKVAMQGIIGDVLKSKNQLSTNEFIFKLEARGVKVLFNQASTGYVSGISYSYQGLVMQGSKLGNGFKWSTVKNIINYEQERDRQKIARQMLDPNTPSINYEQVTTMLGEIQQTHKEVLSIWTATGFGKDIWTLHFQLVIRSYNL